MSGLTLAVYNSVSELPSNSPNGATAWVGGSTNTLYISNGAAWYSTGTFSDVALSTYTLAGDYHYTLLSKADVNWVVSNDYLNGISIDPNDNSINIPGLETSASSYKPAIWKLNNPSSGLPSLSWSSILTVNAGNDPMSDSDTDADGNIYYVYWGKTNGGDYGGIFAKVSPTGNLIWESVVYDNNYATSNANSKMLVESIQIDKANNIAVIGCRDNDLTASFIQKWDISQTTPSITWSRKLTYGTSIYDGNFSRAIIDNNGNIYTTGVSAKREQDLGVSNPRKDVFVTKHSSDGTLQWQKHYCTSETPVIEVRGFATDSENNLILGGYGFTYDNGSQSDRDWLLKLDDDGNILWQRHIGQDTDGTTTVDNTTRLGSVRQLLVDADDFIIVVGGSNRIGFFDPDGVLIRSMEFSPSIGSDTGLVLDNNNNLVIVSSASTSSTGLAFTALGIYVLPSNSQLIQTGTYNDPGNSLGIDVIISEYNDLVIYSNGSTFEVNNGIASVTSVTTSTTTTGTTRASGSGYQVYNTALPPYGPVISSVLDAGSNGTPFYLSTDGTPTVITVTATDVDGTPLTYSYSVTAGSLGSTATVSQADNVFTVTPSTTDTDAGSFSLTFTASSGGQTDTSPTDWILAFPSWYGDRHVYHIGLDDSSTLVASDTLEYFSITSAGNAQDFSNLSASKYKLAACGDASRGIFAGGTSVTGSNWAGAVNIKVIDYINIAYGGNASDFGDLNEIKRDHMMTSDGIRGISVGGVNSNGSLSNAIEYITIQTTGDGSEFGDLLGNYYNGSAFNDATRSVIADGNGNSMEYVTTQTLGNATDFGDHPNTQNHSGSSDATRGLIIGGNNISTISYVTIQTTGNTNNFGDLYVARMKSGSASDGTYSTTVGGHNSNTVSYNTIDKVTIQTTGNATDYADMTVVGYDINSVSGNAS